MKVILVLLSFIVIFQWSHGEHLTVVGKSRFFNNKHLRSLMSNMNLEVDPCKDFYEYACGNWAENHVDVEYTSGECMMEAESIYELSRTLNLMNYRNKTGFEINVMDYFKTCKEARDDFKYMGFINEFEKLEGIKYYTNESDNNWPRLLGVMRRYGMNNVFLTEEIYDVDGDLNGRFINLKKPESFDPISDKDSEVLAELFPDFMESFPEEFEQLEEFEKGLEEIYNLSFDPEEESFTLENFPVAWFGEYLSAILNVTSMDPEIEVTIEDLQYFRKLADYIQHFHDGLVNRYVEMRFASFLAGQMPDEINDKNCMEMASRLMPLSTHWIYEQQHPEVVEEFHKVYKLFDNLHAEIAKTFESKGSEIFPEKSLKKIKDLKLKIGILPRNGTIEMLEELYETLKTNKNNFYLNHLKISTHNFLFSHSVNTRPLVTNPEEYYDVDPPIGKCSNVMPYYYENLIMVPVTHLRQPYFHWAYSDFSIYSTLGVRIVEVMLQCLEFNTDEDDGITEIAALHIAMNAFFSNLPENYKESEIVNAMKKVFILHSAQYYCDDNGEEMKPQEINKIIHQSTKFSEVFGCKSNDIISLFAH